MYNKISNQLFYSTKQNEKGLIKKCNNDKVLLIMKYMYQHEDRRNNINFSLLDLIESCNYKPKTGQNKINEQFKNILLTLNKNKIIKLNILINNIKPKQLYKAKILIDMSKNYFELYDNEYDKIMTYNKEKIDNLKLLTLFCDLKCRMYKRKNNEKNINIYGGRVECCNPSYKTIMTDINITEGIISKYLEILWELNLIRYNKDTSIKMYHSQDKNKVIKNIPNFYVLYENNWKNKINETIKLYKKDKIKHGWIFKNLDEDNINYSLMGKKGNLQRKINNNNATNKDIQEYNKIINIQANKIGKNNHKYELQYLFKTYPNKTLFHIYDELNKPHLADKYAIIEDSLKLCNNNDELLVSWDYYKWIMMNYNKNQHEYYKNCVTKYIKINKNKKIER